MAVRENVILITLEPFRALIFRKHCLIIPPQSDFENEIIRVIEKTFLETSEVAIFHYFKVFI